MASQAPVRRRNAEATRAAILASARACFTRAGYDGAGVREIAAGAGVSAMLVNRYFGSKEKLFAEVCADTMAAPMILADDNLAADDMALHMAKALVDITGKGATPMDGFLILLHSASSKTAAKIGRAEIEKHHFKTLAGAIDGELVPQRAALMLGLVAGFQVMRQMIGLSSLTKAKPADLVKLLTPLIRQLIVVGELPKKAAPGKTKTKGKKP